MFDRLLCVSIAVNSLADSVKDYEERLGLVSMGPVHESERGYHLRWQNLGNGEDVLVELIEPTDHAGPIAKFLERRGEGVYQVRLVSNDLRSTVNDLKSRGARVIGADSPDDTSLDLAWIHPSSTHGVLFELVPANEA